MPRLLFHCLFNFLASLSPFFSSPSSAPHLLAFHISPSINLAPPWCPSSPPSASALHHGLPPFFNICWSASVTADLPVSHAEFPFSPSQRGPLSPLHTHTRQLVTSQSPTQTQREKHSRPLIADTHYAARISIKETSHQRLNASFKRRPGLHFNGTFTHHRFEAESATYNLRTHERRERRLRSFCRPQIKSGGSDNS